MFGWFKTKKDESPAPAVAELQAAPKPLKEGLARTRKSFLGRVNDLFLGRRRIDQELLDELEEILITADLGMATSQELLECARQLAKRDEMADATALKRIFREKIAEFLSGPATGHELNFPESGPLVIMVLGVNGVGKTTSIGKLAHKFRQAGRRVLLVAADTFRAAAVEQLQIWGKRAGVEVVAREAGADPSSVVFDALDSTRGRESEVIIIDTAGRMHTKVNLVEELKKIKRVMGKKIPDAPHEILLVIDATTGQNAISQARLFNEAVEITGLILTKLDGTAKGGIVVNICRELQIPIRFIGVGEQMADLRDFEPAEFARALLEDNGDQG
jgi:fused signal recognition particle receptor